MRYFLWYLAFSVCIAFVIVTAEESIKKKALLSSIIRNNATVVPVPTSGLYWNNLSVQDAKGKFLLHNFCGCVENGHVCGILGPSGKYKRSQTACTLTVITFGVMSKNT